MYIAREPKCKEDCKINLFSIKFCLRIHIGFYHLLRLAGGRLHIGGSEYKFCSQN